VRFYMLHDTKYATSQQASQKGSITGK